MDFSGKIVVITGASSGIGKETAFAFAARGAELILIGRDVERLQEVQTEVMKAGAKTAVFVKCDVSNYGQVQKTCEAIKEKFVKIDVLVNNAGFGIYRAFAEQEIEELERLMKTNYFGTAYFTKELLAAIPSGGHIVNVSSMAGKLSFPNYSAYCASKFAVAAFTESIYHELLGKGIGVHLICPIGTKTHFFDNESFDNHPHRLHYDRMMEPSEIARLILEAIEKNKIEVVPTLREKLAVILKAVAPSIYHKIMQTRYVKRQIEKRAG